MQVQPIAVTVLGMHRSGTSAMARVLNLLGCALPKTLMPPGVGNEEGHWESVAICDFNDRVLHQLGSSWDDWLSVNPLWPQSPDYEHDLENAATLLGQEYGDAPVFVLKDPRHCRLTTFWIAAIERFGAQARFVLPLRSPLEVAASLHRRDGTDVHYGLLLWLRYTIDAERATRGQRRVFVAFSTLLDDWRAVVAQIAAGLDIDFPVADAQVADEITGFLQTDLRHHTIDNAQLLNNPALSGWIRRVFGILNDWALRGEANVDYAALDAVAAAIDQAAPAFAGLVYFARAQMRLEAARLESVGGAGVEIMQEDGFVSHEELTVVQGLLEQERKHSASQEASLQAVHRQLKDSEAHLLDMATRSQALGLERHDVEVRLIEATEQLVAAQAQLAHVRDEHDRLLGRLGENFNQQREAMAAKIEAAGAQAERLGHRVAELENNLRQRQEEIEQAWAELARERAARLAAEAALAKASEQIATLGDRLGESEGWVFRLAGERRRLEADQLRMALRVARAEKSQADMQARLTVALTAPVLPKSDPNEGQQARDAAAELEAQVVARVAGERKTAEQAQELVNLRNALTAQEARLTDVGSARNDAERRLNERYSEVATLTSLLRQQNQATKTSIEQAEWLRQVHAVMSMPPKWSAILPAARVRKILYDRMARRGLFDAGGYLAQYPDVGAVGMDPLRHYILHGMDEGRTRGV